ncbi:MAG: hypothetical protein QME63_09665 [Actinomycetota bacterium]|nr:hypothetical protein [Actinomycetota bacterium]
MALIILINAIIGLWVALLYYPGSPFYLFQNIKLEEVWLWAKCSAFLAGLLFILALLSVDTDRRGRDIARSLASFVAVLQGISNVPPIIMYIIFLRGFATANIVIRGNLISISSRELILHIALAIISFSAAGWLAFKGRKPKSSESVECHAIDKA